ncbi:MAG: hypothetical protein R3C25_04340 [Hyphomonadaceae bacterium]
MLRRNLLAAAVCAAASPAAAQTGPATGAADPQQSESRPIQPQNALEYAFLSALTDERMRPIFRRYLMETHVALALASADQNSRVRMFEIRPGFQAAAIFTSTARIDEVMGAGTPRIVISGRAALERLRESNVVINPGLVPMLTLEPEDVALYLATPGESSAGPTQ